MPHVSQSIRITFITHYAELYGANLSLLALIDGLRPLGVEARVFGPDHGDLMTALAARGVPAAVRPFEWWVSTRRDATAAAGRAYRNLRHLRAITRQLREWGTDLVYSNASVFNIGALAAVELGVPHVWHLREFGRQDYDLLPDLGRKMHRLGFLSADATVCVSHAIRRALLANAERPSVHVVYNGVGSGAVFDERKAKADALRTRTQPFTFVLVGRFRESKGQHVAIRAFAAVAQQFPDCRLLMVGGAGGTGDEAYFEMCRALPAELGVADRVDFWGYIPDPERAFLAGDCALMCSRSEAMGRVTAEAMSCGRPVIGFDAAGTSELIDHGKTGLLYRDGADGLAEAMARYLSNAAEATAHGDAGWVVARGRHTTEGYAANVLSVIRGVIGR
ncbi:MAG: glycosyltransferase family 4 protein [Fimbriiglobus sp.]|jgi:glycosyltransferase involved in cell wall biosynthesis|nr:glycosyltransferase family 4 protein [Fimbriiglobus sp.]